MLFLFCNAVINDKCLIMIMTSVSNAFYIDPFFFFRHVVYNYSCQCCDEDVCHLEAQMMNDMKHTNEGDLYTSQVVKIYLKFPAPASACSWLASTSGWSCTCQKCVSGELFCYLCLLYCYIFPFIYFLFFFHRCGPYGNLTFLNTSLGIVDGVVAQFHSQELLLCGKILSIWWLTAKF